MEQKIDFGLKGVHAGHFNHTYRKVECVKYPFDMTLYQMLIFDIRPDLIIEIGTYKGGSALYFSDLLDIAGNGGVVHTIDVSSSAHPLARQKKNITFYHGGYAKYDVAKEAAPYKKIIVIDDGPHCYEDCLATLEKFHKVVSVGSYFIMEDGIVEDQNPDNEFRGGPCKAIREFLDKHPGEYMIDRRYCDFYGVNTTCAKNGWLKRLR